MSKSTNQPIFPLLLEKFIEYLISSKFKVEKYQEQLVVTTEEDVPFKLINQELHNCDLNDFEPGKHYYLLSNSWFYRW